MNEVSLGVGRWTVDREHDLANQIARVYLRTARGTGRSAYAWADMPLVVLDDRRAFAASLRVLRNAVAQWRRNHCGGGAQ